MESIQKAHFYLCKEILNLKSFGLIQRILATQIELKDW